MTVEENSNKFGVNKLITIDTMTSWRHLAPTCGWTAPHGGLSANDGGVIHGASVDFEGVWHLGQGPLWHSGLPQRSWGSYFCLEPNLEPREDFPRLFISAAQLCGRA